MVKKKLAVKGICIPAATRAAPVKIKAKRKKTKCGNALLGSDVDTVSIDGGLRISKRKRSRSNTFKIVETQKLIEQNLPVAVNNLSPGDCMGKRPLQAGLESKSPAAEPRKKKSRKTKVSSSSQAVVQYGSSSNGQGNVVEHPTSACISRGADFRKRHNIVVPASCPPPLETFDVAEKLIGESLTNALRLQGFKDPTPIQAQAWPILFKGEDMIGVARTGSGKTYAFLLPAFSRLADRKPGAEPEGVAHPRILILAPTRELAQQIAMEARKLAPVVRALVVCVHGGAEKRNQIRELQFGVDVLVATPGRLLDFAKGDKTRNLEPAVSLETVSYLVLDEADRMLDMGFGREINEIIRFCPKPGRREEGFCASGSKAGSRRQTVLFTATWPDAVQRAAKLLLSSAAVQVWVEQNQNSSANQVTVNTDIMQKVLVMKEKDKMGHLKKIIENDLRPGQTAIVFASRKDTCDSLEEELRRLAVCAWCRAIHGDKEQSEREQSLSAFRSMTLKPQPNRKAVLVATDVASRGLDVPGIALVVIYDFGGEADRPGVESYVHRVGRAGRAGRKGAAITFFTPDDSGSSAFAELLRDAKQIIPAELQALADQDAAWLEESRWWQGKKGKGFSRCSRKTNR